MECDVGEYVFSRLVCEGYVVEMDIAFDGIEGCVAGGAVVFGFHVHEFFGSVEAGEGFGELAADVAHLDDGGDHEAEVEGEREKVAGSHEALHDAIATEAHDAHAGEAEQECGGAGNEACGCEALLYVEEQLLNPCLEGFYFAFLGIEPFDDTDAIEGFRESSGHFGIDDATFAEDGAYAFECFEGYKSKYGNRNQDHCGHGGAYADEQHQAYNGAEDATDELHEACADEVSDAFDVVHDAGDEGSGLVVIEEPCGQAQELLLHVGAEYGYEALCFDAEQPGEHKRGDCLDDNGGCYPDEEVFEVGQVAFGDDFVHKVFTGGRQYEACHTADNDQDKPDGEEFFAGPDDGFEDVGDGDAGFACHNAWWCLCESRKVCAIEKVPDTDVVA